MPSPWQIARAKAIAALSAGQRSEEDKAWLQAFIAQFGQVRYFGQGGVAMKPTFGVFGEREPEAVIPLSRLSGMISMAAPIVHVYIDGREVGATVRAEHRQHGRRNPSMLSGIGLTA
jgi:hypothetical protein